MYVLEFVSQILCFYLEPPPKKKNYFFGYGLALVPLKLNEINSNDKLSFIKSHELHRWLENYKRFLNLGSLNKCSFLVLN